MATDLQQQFQLLQEQQKKKLLRRKVLQSENTSRKSLSDGGKVKKDLGLFDDVADNLNLEVLDMRYDT